jgi:Predicted transcriptional regulator
LTWSTSGAPAVLGPVPDGRRSCINAPAVRSLYRSPERRYELAGRLLAAAIEDAERSGDTPRTALDRRAYQLGKRLGEAALTPQNEAEHEEAVLRILDDYGFEPRTTDAGIVLGNCPFHTLAQEHTAMVCGMNLRLLDGLLAGLSATGLRAKLDPAPGYCCVRLKQVRT